MFYVDDNILSLNGTELSANISIAYDKITKQIILYGKDTSKVISTIDVSDFVKDGMIDKVEVVTLDNGKTVIRITWNTESGYEITDVPADSLIQVYEAGEGLIKINDTFSIKLNTNVTENFLRVDNSAFAGYDVLTTVDELNDIDFVVKGKKFVLPDGVSDLKDVSFNKKEYLLKRTVYYFDNEGTKLDKTDIFYIHIVFDLYDDIADHYYVVNDKFDKKLGEENHYLFVFYTEGFCYRNEYMVDNDLISYAFEYKEQDIDFKEMQELDYVTKKVTDLLIPESKTQYSFNGFVYTVIVPLIAAAFGLLLARRKVVLQNFGADS